MNLVMQFRKVCNHPELLERNETKFSFTFSLPTWSPSVIRENYIVTSVNKSPIGFELPRLIYREGKLS